MARLHDAHLRPLFVIAAVALLSSCESDPGIRRYPLEPSASPGVLFVAPGSTTLGYIGERVRLGAHILMADGNPVTGFRYVWRSLDESVVTVDSEGAITAIAEGTAEIIVAVMNLADTATVTVKRLPAAVTVSPDTVLFTALSTSRAITASVVDGGGQPLSTQEIAWRSSDTLVATVSPAGVITSRGQGLATVTAQAGAVSRSVRVRVAVGPAFIVAEPASVSLTALGDTVRITGRVYDAAGTELPVPVAFRWGDTTIATISTTGLVTAKRPGNTVVSLQGDTIFTQVPVSVTQRPVSITTAPDSATVVLGGQATFSASVADRNGYPIPSPVVTWSSSNTSVASVTSAGTATGLTAGTSFIVARVGTIITDTSLIRVVDVPVAVVAVTPDSASLLVGQQATLSARFFAAGGVELLGPKATWTSADQAVAVVSSAGVVTGTGSGATWIKGAVGAAADSTRVTVTAPSGAFGIEIRFVGASPSGAQLAAFTSAEIRWEQIIVGDLPSANVNIAANTCGLGHPAVTETVDDLLIFASVTAIDGPGGVLGQAGPCLIRTASGLTIIGSMQFDAADVAALEASGDLSSTILHEMGHVLGFGTSSPWDNRLVDGGTADPYWPGPTAVARYDAAGGTAIRKVPVEATGGAGTADAHWRETEMGRELMTGFLNSGQVNALSAISIGAMQDLGYSVNLGAADTYTVGPALRAAGERLIEIRDVVRQPVLGLTPDGRIVPLTGR